MTPPSPHTGQHTHTHHLHLKILVAYFSQAELVLSYTPQQCSVCPHHGGRTGADHKQRTYRANTDNPQGADTLQPGKIRPKYLTIKSKKFSPRAEM